MSDIKESVDAARTEDLLGSTDPQRWTREFMRIFPGIWDKTATVSAGKVPDEDDLIAWFSNAFQAKESALASKDRAAEARQRERLQRISGELEGFASAVGMGIADQGKLQEELQRVASQLRPSRTVVEMVGEMMKRGGLSFGEVGKVHRPGPGSLHFGGPTPFTHHIPAVDPHPPKAGDISEMETPPDPELTLEEMRALLCGQRNCKMHPPGVVESAMEKVANSVREQEREQCDPKSHGGSE